MILRSLLALGVTLALASPALAQSTSGKSLNLDLPPQDLPAAPSSAHAAARPASAASSARSAASQPGMYYGDTSGRTDLTDTAPPPPPCDDSTYNQPQVHGSVGMGAVSGRHIGGTYQTGSVTMTKAFGSCEHPTGGMSISVSVGQNNIGGH